MIGQEWPCWLTTVLALKLPVLEVYMSPEFGNVFTGVPYSRLESLDVMKYVPHAWNECTVLASGSHEYLSFLLTKLRYHEGPFIYSTDIVFKGRRPRDVKRLYQAWTSLHDGQGLCSRLVSHADFGGVTSAIHLVSYKGIDDSVFDAPPVLPRRLEHVINSASPDSARAIPTPDPLTVSGARCPVVENDLLHCDGLYDVFRPELCVACRCVFKTTDWAARPLSATEFLRAFDSPLDMDSALLDPCRERRMRSVLPRSIAPSISSAIFCSMWSNNSGGVDRIADARRQEPTLNELACQIKQDMPTELEAEYEDEHEDASWAYLAVEHSMWEEKIRASARMWSPTTWLKFEIGYHTIKEETVPALKRDITMTAADREASEEMLNQLRQDHGDAKAVKSDNAEVPEHIGTRQYTMAHHQRTS